LQCEVAHHPHETRKVLGVFFWVSFLFDASRFDLNMLGQVDYETKLLKCVFIDATNAVIYEKTGKQDCQRENSNIMVGVFIKSAQTLSVEY
jgi:hypothetical protein